MSLIPDKYIWERAIGSATALAIAVTIYWLGRLIGLWK